MKRSIIASLLVLCAAPAYAFTYSKDDGTRPDPRIFNRNVAECNLMSMGAIGAPPAYFGNNWGAEIGWNVQAQQVRMTAFHACMVSKGYMRID
jgi:hypothetical protein